MHPPPLFASVTATLAVVINLALQALTFIPGISLSPYLIAPAVFASLLSFLSASGLVHHFLSMTPSIRTGDFLKDWGEVEKEKWRYQAKIFKAVTWPWRGVLLFLAAYALLLVVVYENRTHGATPTAGPRSFYLSRNGEYVRALSQQEYQLLQALNIRAWSAGLLLISVASFVGTNLVYPTIAHETYTASKKWVRDLADSK